MRRHLALLLASIALVACSSGGSADAGLDDGASGPADAGRDAAGSDGALAMDAGNDASATDAGHGTGIPPVVNVLFPPPHSLTDTDNILLRGTAAGDEGVSAIRVGGVDARSSDGFATWTARVGLVPGENALVIEVVSLFGTTDPHADARTVRY